MGSCPFDALILSQSVPHILELIFVRHLPHRDLLSCLRVSPRWRHALAAHLLAADTARPSVRRRCLSNRLAHQWTEAEVLSRELDAVDVTDGGDMSLCFADGGPSDALLVLSGHGQRRCVFARLSAVDGALLATRRITLEHALSSVTTNADVVVCTLSGATRPLTLSRKTLEDVAVTDLRGRRLAVSGEELYSIMWRSPDSHDLVVTRLQRDGERWRMSPCSTVREIGCAVCKEGNKRGFHHEFGLEGALLAVACNHGRVTLYDVGCDSPMWSHNHLNLSADYLMDLKVSDSYVTAAFRYLHQDAGPVANDINIVLIANHGGSVIKSFWLPSSSRPVIATSPSLFVLGSRSNDNDDRLDFSVFDVRRSGSVGGDVKRFSASIGNGFQKAEVLRDRLLLVQAFVSQPRLRSGEVHVFDLCSSTARVFDRLNFSGPLNQKLLTKLGDEAFLSLRDHGKTLAKTTFQEDEQVKEIFRGKDDAIDVYAQ